MKKTLAILLVVMLLAAIMPASSLAASYSKTTVYRVKASSGLKVRAGAGTKYKAKATLSNGTAFTVTKTSGSWYKIKVLKTGVTGWVAKKYTTKNAYARITTVNQGLNVRTGPAEKKYAIKGSIPKGTKNVLVKYISGNWAYVKYGKLEGWASRTFLKWMV